MSPQYSDSISVIADGDRMLLPDWARAQIWLGWWCRRWQLPNQRLLAVTVLPAREMAAAFVGLGCLFAGAELFQRGFTWEDLRRRPPGSKLYWRRPGVARRYEGVIQSPDVSMSSQDLVRVTIASGPPREIGTTWFFSRARFMECIFSEESLPTQGGAIAVDNAARLHRELGLKADPRWYWTAGAEARILTNQTRFHDDVDRIGISSNGEGSEPVPLIDALLCASINDGTLAKLRISSSRQSCESDFPCSVIDGASGFGQIRNIHSGNVLIILDRTEYSSEIHNELLEAGSEAVDPPLELVNSVPRSFPPGMDVSAFLLPGGR